jgi:hypothetical protein
MKRMTIACAMALLAVLGIVACTNTNSTATQTPTVVVPDGPFTYDGYSTLLGKYLDEQGMVDYKSLKENRNDLDIFVAQMGQLSRETYDAWTKEAQLAFWINAYNAITLQAIINHYPIQPGSVINRNLYPANSIRQISGVWDKLETKVLGLPMTLNAIEHEVLRVDFDEPRIHVSIVCASIGCPPLRNEAFVGEKLEAQLTDQSKQFVGHVRNFKIDTADKTIYLSSILDWFGEDFEGSYAAEGRSGTEAAIVGFVHTYAPETAKSAVADATYSIEFQDYDWALNEQP